MSKSDDGMDPESIFMNAALNVITSFLTSEQFEHGQPEQRRILEANIEFLGHIDRFFLVKAFDSVCNSMLPKFIFRKGYHRKLLRCFAPSLFLAHVSKNNLFCKIAMTSIL